MKKTIVLGVWVFAFGISGCSFMDKHFRKVTYRQGSMGDYMNDRFKTLVQQCRVVPSEENVEPKDYEGRDFLPNNFAMRRDELDALPIAQSWHSSQMFLYPFTQGERDAYVAHAADVTKTVPVLNEQHLISEREVITDGLAFDILPRSKPGIDAILYRQSCATYVSANAGGGISLPLVSVQSALEAQVTTGGRASLATGFFESPFTDMLDGGGARSTYASLLLWERYRRSPELLTGQNYVLKGFKGAILLGAVAQSTGTKVDLAVAAGGSAGPASGTAKFDARYEASSEYRGESFKTLIPALDDSAFRALEDPKAIREAFSQVFTLNGLEPTGQFASGKLHEHRFTLAGIPASICEGKWTVSDVRPNVYDSIPVAKGTASVNTAQQMPQCTFAVSGTPLNSVVVNPTPPAFGYTLTSALSVGTGNGQQVLSFAPAGLQFRANPNPQWTPIFASLVPTPEPVGTMVRWRWKIPFNINDRDNPVDRQRQIDLAVEGLKCANGRSVPVNAEVKRDEVTQQYDLSLSTIRTHSPPAGGLVTEPCELVAKMNLPVEGGASALRERKLVLDVPKEQPPATPATELNVNQLIERLGAEQNLRERAHGGARLP